MAEIQAGEVIHISVILTAHLVEVGRGEFLSVI